VLQTAAWISIALAVACALWIAFAVVRRPQPMAVMNVVWPVSALYLSIFARFWLMMQIAMICGDATSFPVNGWLSRAGIKEAM